MHEPDLYSNPMTPHALAIAKERDRRNASHAELLGALRTLLLFFQFEDEDALEHFEILATFFQDETGYLRPGKDCAVHSPEKRREVWDKWVTAKTIEARAVLAKATKEPGDG